MIPKQQIFCKRKIQELFLGWLGGVARMRFSTSFALGVF